MNSPSNRRHAGPWLLIGVTCCGLLVAHIAGSFVTAQENPVASPPTALAQPPVPPPVAAPEFLPRLSANAERISQALDESTEMALVDTPLLDALIFLKELHNIELWLDKEALSAEGIATDQLVSLSISGISLRSGLQLLLQPLQLTYVIENEVLKITTQEAADKRLVTRTYPAGYLFDTPEEASELIDVIMSGLGLGPEAKGAMPRNSFVPQSASLKTLTVGLSAPQDGKSGSAQKKGAGTIAVSFKARAIVARQTLAVHDEIRQLLRDLREAKSFAPARPAHELGGIGYPNSSPTYGPNRGAFTPNTPASIDEFSPGTPTFTPPRGRPVDPPQDDLSPSTNPPVPTKPRTVR